MITRGDRVDLLAVELEKQVLAQAAVHTQPYLVVLTCELFWRILGPEHASRWAGKLNSLFRDDGKTLRKLTEIYFTLVGMRTKFYKK